MSNRFTVSLHRFVEGGCSSDGRRDHLDWFFSANDNVNGPLVTWSTSIGGPSAGGGQSRRLLDHRVRYLDYDGDISGGRGCVQRLVTGACQLMEHDAASIEFAVKSVAVADSAMGDIAVAKLATDLCEQLLASIGDRVRLST